MNSTSNEATARYVVALDRLQYANLGLYAWEYLSHLDHDRRLVRGVWPWRWPLTTWAYLICRNATLLAVITSVTTVGNVPCSSLVVRFSYFLPYPLLFSAAFLMAARVVAIWCRATWVIIVTAMGLAAYLVIAIYGTIVLRVGSVHLPGVDAFACVDLGPNHAESMKISITTTSTVDALYLSLIFLGLWNHREARLTGLLRLLWTQSLVLLFLAVVITGIPLMVLVWMEVNGAILAMGLEIGYLLVGLGSTRMSRALYNSSIDRISLANATSTTAPVVPELTNLSMRDSESRSTNLSSLAFSRPVHKAESTISLELCSTCASSSVAHNQARQIPDCKLYRSDRTEAAYP